MKSALTLQAYWDQYQVIAGGAGCVTSLQTGVKHPEGSPPTLLELARELVDDGIVLVRWRRDDRGGATFTPPEVTDSAELARRLLALVESRT